MNDANSEHPIEVGASHQVSIGHVQADTLSLDQSAAQTVEAGAVVTHLSAVAEMRAGQIDAQASAFGTIGAQQSSVHTSSVGAMQATEATITKSVVGGIQSTTAHVHDGAFIGLLIARQVNGTARPLLDWRGVLVLGLVIGLVLRLTTSNR
jgi:hypothetical protein